MKVETVITILAPFFAILLGLLITLLKNQAKMSGKLEDIILRLDKQNSRISKNTDSLAYHIDKFHTKG